jgi:diguanylate cyclase
MNNNRKASARDSRDWKDKYLTELENQEKRERLFRQQMELLVRAVTRISLVAEGVDQQLDKQLAGLRQMLREEIPTGRDLNTMVSALEGQVKRMDVVKAERAKVLAGAFQSLVKQLKDLNADKDARQKLKRFSKDLKGRSARMYDYSALVNEYANVQQSVLDDHTSGEPNKPFWQNWFTQGEGGPSEIDQPAHDLENTADPSIDLEADEEIKSDALGNRFDSAKEINPLAELDLSEDILQEYAPSREEVGEQDPPFKRLSKAICSILTELLEQIEPPPMALENYKNARKQVESGLNWYELVPTLEDISIVVISAFDDYHKEFEQFLTQLNQRLSEANQLIYTSEQAHGASQEAGRRLNASVREQVTSMQQSVENATELDQLKLEVTGRLDSVLSAMDQHQADEHQQEDTLSEQLHTLIERVKVMERDSASAESRIEEQRQRALRDVLTQLPNREGYQARLEQEFERWKRYKRPLTLIVCDIDHFKRVNDTYGHLAGDKVLRIIAKSLAKRLRKTDFIARYGGEEFVVLMPETEQSKALTVADGVRSAISSCPFHFKETPVSITLSFGITEFMEPDKPDSAFARADKALYIAKEQGRNRCIVAQQNGGEGSVETPDAES